MHHAFMDKESLGDRLKALRIKKFGEDSSAADAARAIGIPLPTYWGHENGHREPDKDTIKRYVAFYRTTADYLFTGKPDVRLSSQTPIVGYVGAGAQIFPIDDHAQGQGLELVEPPIGVDFQCVAARVRGDSMFPVLEDGWIIFWNKEYDGVPNECIGKLCVVQLQDGRLLVKRLHRGSVAGRFTLVSHNAPPEENAAVEWAARVVGIRPT